MKVMTIVGTRPEIIKLSRVIAALDCHCEHILVHTGQNYDYELNEIFFSELQIRKPDCFLAAAGDSAAATIANVIAAADTVLEQYRPQALLLLGDTNSCMAAIAAKRRKIPIFHMEAGNRCFDLRVPEEINRKIVDHLSDINMTYTEHARRYLLAEGIGGETIIKTGSPMGEVLAHYRPGIEASTVLERLDLRRDEYFVVSAHREENIDSEENFADLLATLDTLATRYRLPIIFSAHPRTRKRLESAGVVLDERIQCLKPLGFFDYIKLQSAARCVISDSGTITEEASLLGFPAITIRQAHERPEGMDEGTLIMCGLKAATVVAAIDVVCAQHSQAPPRPVADYQVPDVARKVVRIIMSYTDYVNRSVWKKYCS